MIVLPTDENIQEAVSLIHGGEVVVFPTETVYGLGGDFSQPSAVRKIYTLKNRPSNNPLILHTGDFESIFESIEFEYGSFLEGQINALHQFIPGPLTLILPAKKGSPFFTFGKTIGVRVPSHPVAQKFLRECKVFVAAPSANPSGYISPTSAQHVEDSFPDENLFILDGGSCPVGLESTILSLLDPSHPAILRPGAITREVLEDVLKTSVVSKENFSPGEVESSGEMLSPGLMKHHYAPRTETRFLTDAMERLKSAGGKRVGFIAFSPGERVPFDFAECSVLSSSGDMEEVARKLFGALREFDQMNLDLIVVDECQDRGIGAAILNRLIRATASK